MMKIVGKKVKAGKPQHLVVGKVYEVSEKMAKALIANGQAEDANKPKPKPAKSKKED